jgi:hypothetical protein
MTDHQPSRTYLTGLDWTAAIWAGLVSGLVMFLVSVLLPWIILGDALLIVRIMASVLLGPTVIPAHSVLAPGIYAAALITHVILSLFFTLLIAIIFHRWGMLVAFIGGAMVGVLIYVMNYYSFTFFFPWMAPYLNWMVLVAHIFFGALAGSLFELFEDDRFVDEPFFRRIEPTLVKTQLSHVSIWGKEGE